MQTHQNRIMAIDFGLKRIGVAISDPMKITAQGLCVIESKSKKKDVEKLSQLVKEHSVNRIIVGKPVRFSGEEGTLGKQVEEFAGRLAGATGLEVILVDERLTTVQAERMLIDADVSRAKRKEVIDKVAAQYLLQGYLDSLPR